MMKHWKKTVATFMTSQLVSLIGTLFVSYAITWYVTLETQSGVMLTISILCGFVPGIFLAPFAGVWADRFSRRKLIIIADAMIAVITLITVIIFILGYREIWLLFIISIFRSSGQAIQQPAVGASAILLGIIPIFWPYLLVMSLIGIVIPLLNTPSMVIIQRKVDPHFMGRVMSVLTIVSSSMNPLGMLVFGPLADVVSIETILIISGALLLIAAGSILFSPALMQAGIFSKKPTPINENID